MKFFNSLIKPSITNKLLFWFLLIAVIPFLCTGFIITKIIVESLKEEAINNLSEIADHRVSEIKTFINNKKHNLERLAHLPNIASSVYKLIQIHEQKGVHSSEYKALHRQIREYSDCFWENSSYKDIFIISPNGNIVFDINRNLKTDVNFYSDSLKKTYLGKLFNEVILSKTTQISDFKWYGSLHESVACIAAPIVIKDVFFGVFVIEFRSKDICEFVSRGTDFGKTSDVLLVTKQNDSLAYIPCKKRHENSLNLDFKKIIFLNGSKDFSPIQKAAEGLKGEGIYTDFDGTIILASYRYIPQIKLGLVVQLDKNEAFKPITGLLRTILIISIISLLLTIITVFVISKSITDPIVNLTKTGKSIAEGNISAKAHVKTTDELHDLAVSFNNMLAERKKTEDALHTSEERLTKILNSSPDSIVVIDLNGRVHECNQTAINTFRFSKKEELIGLDALNQVDPLYRKKAIFHLQKTLKTGASKNVDYYCRDREGNKFPVEVSASTILDINNKPQSFVIIARDISERKKAEKELFRSNQELEQFAYIASHDLKAPLRAVRQISTWIEEDLHAIMKDDTKKYIGLLRSRVDRMESLLSGLLEYSRVGRTKVEKEIVNTKDLVEDIRDFYNPPKEFMIEPANDLPVFETHRTPFEQIFMNLVGNAIKYHDRHDGCIRVSCNDSTDYYEFLVIDDGPGIEPKFHTKIFEMFQRLKSRDEIEGCGMGLALVKKIVDNYKGSVAVNSTIGKGATFKFTWPKTV